VLVTILGGLGATIVLGLFMLMVVVLVAAGAYTLFKRTKEQGVVYKDGISQAEAATILRIVNESISAEETAKFVSHVHSILGQVVKAGPTPPKVV